MVPNHAPPGILVVSCVSADHEQARLLNAWARQQTLPAIAVGAFNIDWAVINGDTVHDFG
jgi:hypothetical protein